MTITTPPPPPGSYPIYIPLMSTSFPPASSRDNDDYYGSGGNYKSSLNTHRSLHTSVSLGNVLTNLSPRPVKLRHPMDSGSLTPKGALLTNGNVSGFATPARTPRGGIVSVERSPAFDLIDQKGATNHTLSVLSTLTIL